MCEELISLSFVHEFDSSAIASRRGYILIIISKQFLSLFADSIHSSAISVRSDSSSFLCFFSDLQSIQSIQISAPAVLRLQATAKPALAVIGPISLETPPDHQYTALAHAPRLIDRVLI
ncbi:hypothetical protein DTO166G4_8479 [Paecilomyces variotii]|nr:hypothetical protein DTO166G4_8479 [Paecilomyces variotii]KAJ9238627.1 hypothetical protein DTO166G5_2748 [Paecilomyces variotii]KAJ9246790.1 hypothetical protein DTO207G8_8631 [Paecilomyces variotii]KAJ9267200.1 hypothetical protein DTO195F2_433 [Paecilomyces variotii]KAJ9287744.1 hypothetical protein DTO021C3_4802 [Paecilomyces variotii]